ncbi:MAG TPA: carboxypeptidase-like regulatory domain-containing protein [Candidatus Acidoferrales bacterium]|nr:carboxypeptidase-like regulatory domain-containing protein [Candidatus Acidoferrales bacterium]
MRSRTAVRNLLNLLLVCFGALLLCVSLAQAQSGGTGAISGTVTDPSGGSVANVTVTATNLGTNQARTAVTGTDGVYKFSLLTPGNYRVKFSAAGFKTEEIASVAVITTETASANQVLEVGAVTQTVTVESTVQTLQTESSTLGTTVTGANIAALPMANGNYTEILSLTAGTTASVDNATVLGKGTQDISANGVDPGSNNFQMDGVAVNNIANSGSSNDGTIYTGVPIPSPDAIGEFKIQTSTYDASYGRNPGANVNVTTKSGSNDFHGSAFEFFRNTALNSNDFFLKRAQATNGINTRPAFDQNQFGATIGGPIKKDKFFFFFSYRGTRSKNAIAPQGNDTGAFLFFCNPAPPGAPCVVNKTLDTYAALGSRGTCPAPVLKNSLDPNSGDSLTVSNCDATAQAFATAMKISNSNIVGLRMFQLTTGTAKNPTAGGVPNNYYLPAPASDKRFCNDIAGVCNFSIPAIYTENQYVANGDYVFNSKHTLTTKYFYTHNPYTSFLGQMGGDAPGTPEHILFGNHNAVAKLTSLVTSNIVNEARVSFQQNVNGATAAVPPGGCANEATLTAPFGCGSPQQLGMVSLVPGFYEPPTFLNVGTGYGMFGGLLPDKGPTNQLQMADQISWSHGKHSIRAGYEYEWTNWPLADPGLQQGLIIMLGYSAFLGNANNASGLFDLGCLFCVKSTSGAPNTSGVLHFYQLNNQNTYVLDDWKVSSKLTINMGLRWEYDGLLTDKYGHLTQVWLDRMAANSDIPTAFSATTAAGVQQYVVPSNFNANFKKFGLPPAGVGLARNRNSIEGHAPYSDFAPRFGFAWQPLSGGKLVIRGGTGIFYDRIGLDRVVHAFEQGYPYAATYDFGFASPRWAGSSLAQPFVPIPLVCMTGDPNCNSEPNGLGFAPRFADPTTANNGLLVNGMFQTNSGLNTPLVPTSVHTPLVREYSLGFQYEFKPGWVLDLGYVGSSGINLTDYNHNHNGAQLATPTNSLSFNCGVGGNPNVCNSSNNAAFRVPVLGYEPIGLQVSDFNGVSKYNSLQATVRHQFGHGLSMQGAYTWDRNLSDVFFASSANINDALALRTRPGVNGPPHGQWGPVSFDRFQRFVVNYSYDLPIGKSLSGLAGKAIGGWNLSGVTIAQTGNPLTFIGGNTGGAYGTNQQLSFQGVTTAEICPNFSNGRLKNPGGARSTIGSAKGYFNAAAFACPAPVVQFGDPSATDYGNAAVGIATGPGQFNWDVSLVKNTQITERVRMQFRSDFYNAFNHPQFAPPQGTNFGTVGFENVTNFGTPTGNQITATSVNPRLIQFGLHFFF